MKTKRKALNKEDLLTKCEGEKKTIKGEKYFAQFRAHLSLGKT
jgi:hypothetical protein